MAVRLPPIRLGVVGHVVGGRCLHTPFIEAAGGIELAGVVTRSPHPLALVAQAWPGVPVFDSLGAMLASGVDAVTITTPPETRRELVHEAVAAGVHVVADKLFVPSAEVGRELAEAAESAGMLWSVFQNRLWDADIRTLATVIDHGPLGLPWRVHSRLDVDDPEALEAGPGGGLVRDIGSHLVDPDDLAARRRAQRQRAPGLARPARGLHRRLVPHRPRAHLWCPFDGRVQQRQPPRGARGACLRQRGQLPPPSVPTSRRRSSPAAGRPTTSRRGATSSPRAGGCSPSGRRGVGALRAGPVPRLLHGVAAAVRGEGRQPVPAPEGIRTLAVLDAARLSAERGGSVPVPPEQMAALTR